MNDDPFDRELKTAFASPELPTSFVEDVIQDIQRQQRFTRVRWAAAAVALLILGGMSWVFWPAKSRAPFPQAVAELQAGKLSVAQASEGSEVSWKTFQGGEHFALAVGTGLRAETNLAARIGIENLGTLTLERESQAEVRSMDWKQFGGGAVVGAVTVGVIVGAIEWNSNGKTQRAVAGEELKLQATEASLANGSDATWSKEKQDLMAKLDQAQTRVTELEKAASRAPIAAEVPAEPATMTEPKAAAPKLATRFGDPELQKVLDEVDWDKTGEAFKNMLPLMAELSDALENDKPIPESVADLQKWNADLVGVALKFMNAGVSGTGANGAFTHPTSAANQIYASLAKMGQGLNENQQAALDQITQRMAAEEHARVSGYGEDSLALQKLFDETALKDRFYDEAGRILNPTQHAALYPERNVGRTNLDIYSTGIVWGPVTRGLPIKDRGDFENQIQDEYGKRFKLDTAGKAQLSSIVREWSQKYVSDASLAYSPDKLGSKGMHKVGNVRTAAEQQLALQKKILSSMNLTASQKKAIMQNPMVWLPFLQKD